MIILTNPSATQKLQVITSAAVTTDVHVSGADWDISAGTGSPLDPLDTAITTAATTDITAAVTSGHKVTIKLVIIRNKHASSSQTVTLQHVSAGATVELFKVTILAGEHMEVKDGVLYVYDANGGIKTAGSPTVDPLTNNFRLSGVSATPVMTADSTTLSTVYLTQYKGNRIALYDGTNWQLLKPSSEVSLAVTGRTTDLLFDVFAYSASGTVTLEFLNWSTATARVTGLTRVDGVWTKTGDATRRYLGTIRARSATQFHWVMAGVDLPAKFDLWNVDNRVVFNCYCRASTATWAYTLTTIRQAQASANYQIDVTAGLQEEYMVALLDVTSTNSTISIGRSVGIGYDSTSTNAAGNIITVNINTVASIQSSQHARLLHQPGIGRHIYSWNEASVATGTCTWTGAGAVAGFIQQSGLTGEWTC